MIYKQWSNIIRSDEKLNCYNSQFDFNTPKSFVSINASKELIFARNI